MIVAGVMSGTSADGINIAMVDIRGKNQRAARQSFEFRFLGHAEYPYSQAVRRAILEAMNAKSAKVAEVARLNFLLGELYSEAVMAAQKIFKVEAALIGCHGQTLYHQGEKKTFLGRSLAVTWQTGEGSVLARRTGIPVVSDFRPADMAAGGAGAPLVQFLDYMLYSHGKIGRIAQNIGGIANLTAISPGATPERVMAFDTGPGIMVIDGLSNQFYGKRFDKDGRIASSGKVLEKVVAKVLRLPFFSRKPPKTAGREEFGREFLGDFLRACGGSKPQDIVATATALTAQSIALAIERFVLKQPHAFTEIVVSGGGTKNATLMGMLSQQMSRLRLRMRSSDEFGVPSEAKEAVAFALLAFQTWHRKPSNMPSATGAKRPAILGKVSYV